MNMHSPMIAAQFASLSRTDFSLILEGLRHVETGLLMTTAPNQPARRRASELIMQLQATAGALPTDQVPTRRQHADAGFALLIAARDMFKRAGSDKTIERIRYAIKSAGGAVRHAQRMEFN